MKALVSGIAVLTLSVIIAAQSEAERPTFDVASVKINRSGAGPTSLGFQPQSGRFRAVNEPLWRFIAEAYRATYQLRRFEIVDVPGSMDGERFDVEAVPPTDSTPAQRLLMLQRLLADRFKLVVHKERRELPIYRLVKARADGRLGDRIKPSPFDCAAIRATGQTPPSVPEGQTRPCVMFFGQGLLRANGMRITDLADMGLSRSVERLVVDNTGLTGGFEWSLEWAPDGVAATPGSQTAASGVPLVTALQEQLGLKLEAARGPVEVVVVDRVEMPTPD